MARAVYDTLTVPDEDANYVPYLAESVIPDATFENWRINLREGIQFHDGTALDATVVRNNLDAWRGVYPGRVALTGSFSFEPIIDVVVVDPLTVDVALNQPWPALPAHLFNSGRLGIMAQAQLDDPEACDSQLIGTGPFMLEDWRVNQSLTVVRNPNYWYTDPSTGDQLPYLDEIEFRPMPEPSSRLMSFEAEELTAMHTASPEQIERISDMAADGSAQVVEADDHTEVQYFMLNTSKPPFDDINARKAFAHAVDMEEFQQVVNLGLVETANGPFAPGEVGFLDDNGFPRHDPEAAAKFAEAYENDTGEPLSFTISGPADLEVSQMTQFVQEQLAEVGIETAVVAVDQSALIGTALGGDFDAIAWRNHPGGNSDGQYIWWKSDSPTNFGRIDDPEIDLLLEQGRLATDDASRVAAYEGVNRRFAEQAYNFWMNWPRWTVATATELEGVLGPDNPDGSAPFAGLATGHPLSALHLSD
ncbi:MAG: ABC transporter substrate-binding protein [Microthrixaceae bacterium]